MAAGKVVDRLQVAAADAVRNGADMRIGGDAAVENRLGTRLRAVTHLADKLAADLDRVLTLAAPGAIRLADRIDKADRACRAEIDGDHLADRPLAGDRAFGILGI